MNTKTKPRSELRSERLVISLTEAQMALVDTKATCKFLTPTHYARQLILEDIHEPVESKVHGVTVP